MPAHTPGPWTIADSSGFPIRIVGADKRAIAKMDGYGPVEADARLIHAAPDMLVALKLALRALEFDLNGDGKRDLAAVLTKTIALAEVES